jgi:hypothetical protein
MTPFKNNKGNQLNNSPQYTAEEFGTPDFNQRAGPGSRGLPSSGLDHVDQGGSPSKAVADFIDSRQKSQNRKERASRKDGKHQNYYKKNLEIMKSSVNKALNNHNNNKRQQNKAVFDNGGEDLRVSMNSLSPKHGAQPLARPPPQGILRQSNSPNSSLGLGNLMSVGSSAPGQQSSMIRKQEPGSKQTRSRVVFKDDFSDSFIFK